MAKFQSQLRGFGVKSLDKVDKIRRASCLELFRLVIYSTPVDTGRLRGNWQTTINTPAAGTLERESADSAMADAVAHLGGMLDVVWFVNNLPYAEPIEYGWSQQAPEGMVRKHVVSWRKIVEAKAKAYGK